MKPLCAAAAVGLSLIGVMGPATAQPYGDRYYGDRDRGFRDRDYGDRGSRARGGDFGDREDDYRGRGRSDRRGDDGFDEGAYLRCNPDVRKAVERGTMPSGALHYQRFGRKEGRRLSC